jgi:DNA polymerase sigma
VDAIGRTATALWPASRTVLFGSQATGLALPGSDLDIVVLGASDELANAATGFSW